MNHPQKVLARGAPDFLQAAEKIIQKLLGKTDTLILGSYTNIDILQRTALCVGAQGQLFRKHDVKPRPRPMDIIGGKIGRQIRAQEHFRPGPDPERLSVDRTSSPG
jgi:hypothetical protein